ncbi:hypothetical protein PhCBS80983_g04587 [Powellomyces hirtus]|uniref:PRA1 family protein n=1 Tax=Powellomyces hirtus TaxID=109895 RepID=A0A507DXC4_9FUNG|nr:hypothetical protein PhCBS80983_g04587 [Powellomyces hirtus]
MDSTSASTNSGGFASYVRVDPQTWQTVKETSRARLASLKPVSDFFDKNRFGKPANVAVFTSRLNYNLIYFQNNYILLVLIVTAYLLFTNFWLLLTIFYLLAGFKFITSLPSNQPTTLPFIGARVTPSQLWPVFLITGLFFVYISGATGTIFYMMAVCALIICAHAGMMDPPVEANFAEESV